MPLIAWGKLKSAKALGSGPTRRGERNADMFDTVSDFAGWLGTKRHMGFVVGGSHCGGTDGSVVNQRRVGKL